MIITLRENGRSHDRAEEENKTGERRTEGKMAMVLAVRGQTFEDDIGRWLHGEQLNKQSVFHSGETVFFTEDKYSKYSDI